MRINLIIIYMLSAISFSACISLPFFVPKLGEIGENQYGSYIKLRTGYREIVKGELIEVGEQELVILDDSKPARLTRVAKQDIRFFRLNYADAPSYLLSSAFISSLTFLHGWWLGVTLPLNLAYFGTIDMLAGNSYSYTGKDVKFEFLKQFARFPQGMPPGFEDRK